METTSQKRPAANGAGNGPLALTGRHGESVWLFFPHPVVITDRQNRILSANPAARKLVGHESGENLWHRIGTVKGLPEESRLSTDEGLVPWSGDVEVTSGSESGTRRLHVIMRPIAETGGGEAARLWILEETDRNHTRTRERERLVLAERAAMAAEIAHDLNNYLAVITGNTELLSMYLDKGSYDNVPRCLANLRRTLSQIETFTDHCLRLRHPVDENGTIDLNRFLSDQIAFFRPQKPFRKIIITAEWGEALPPIQCDPADLQHAFCNIMRNAAEALRAAPADKCTLTVRTEHIHNEGGDWLRILIADVGPGIPSEIRTTVFREPVSTKPGHGGFGLLTAAQIARKCGGTLTTADRPEGGTVIALTLPAMVPSTTD